jgi:sugar lactone lactonase YvrE
MSPRTCMHHSVRVALLLTLSATLATNDPAAAQNTQHGPRTRTYELDPSTHGNPEGIAFDPHTQSFFVGSTGDGTIYRGTLEDPFLMPYIAGDGVGAVGLDVWHGRLYVAGGFSGLVRVYDIASGEIVATFDTGGGGMLNDLVVTPRGDVFITDSWRPLLWHVTADQVEAGSGTPTAIPVSPEIPYAYGPWDFNLNGIVALQGGRRLIVANSSDGTLYRIDLDPSAPEGRHISPIAMEPLFADGLLLDGGRLVAVTFDQEGLAFVKLNADASFGEVEARLGDPSFREPSTVARARNYYLVVNADFTHGVTPFTVTAIPRHMARPW